MFKTIAKVTVLAVLASLFVLSRAQTLQGKAGCTYQKGQCITTTCDTCILSGSRCFCAAAAK
jgi:hypothetical protein